MDLNSESHCRWDDFEAGEYIAGRYQVLGCLGKGTSSTVYKCRDRTLCSLTVALKVFKPEIARDTDTSGLLYQELLTSYRIDHPNVARFFDSVLTAELFAISMELVDGEVLSALLRRRRTAPDQYLDILLQVCTGLEAIHASGVLHRDLKPVNILVASDGQAKITDFGVAKALASAGTAGDSGARAPDQADWGPEHEQDASVMSGGMVGTPYYFSPEYVLDGVADERSDIYALGVIAYECMAGVRPFKLQEIPLLLKSKVEGDPIPPHRVNEACPQEVSKVIMTMMHRDPAKRYQSASAVRQVLKVLQTGSPRAATTQVLSTMELGLMGPKSRGFFAGTMFESLDEWVQQNVSLHTVIIVLAITAAVLWL